MLALIFDALTEEVWPYINIHTSVDTDLFLNIK